MIEKDPGDARAPYYLGNLIYDGQPEAAIRLWEKSSSLDPSFPITWRNLAVAYSHQKTDRSQARAIAALEKAVSGGNPYPTHLVELDQLYQTAKVPVEKRLALLEKYQGVVVNNDEALGNLITLKIFAGKAEESIRLLRNRIFSIWEGGTPFNSGQAWADAHLVLGLRQMKKARYREAVASFEAALSPPENLRAEQRFDQRHVLLSYWTGCAHDALGDKGNAENAWNEAVHPGTKALKEGVTGGGIAAGGGMGSGGTAADRMGGNALEQGEQRYYQALARKKLGNAEDNDAVFIELIASATAALNQPAGADAAAPQLAGRQPVRPLTAVAHYIAGLGHAGLGDIKKLAGSLPRRWLLRPIT